MKKNKYEKIEIHIYRNKNTLKITNIYIYGNSSYSNTNSYPTPWQNYNHDLEQCLDVYNNDICQWTLEFKSLDTNYQGVRMTVINGPQIFIGHEVIMDWLVLEKYLKDTQLLQQSIGPLTITSNFKFKVKGIFKLCEV